MGQNSVRGEGTRGRVPRAREMGWDDELYDAGAATGAGPADAPEETDTESVSDTTTRAERRRGTGSGSGGGADGRSSHRRGGSRRRAKKAGKRKVLRWVAITLAVLILGTAGAGYLYYEHLNGNIRGGSRAGGESGVKKAAPNALGDTPLNILLIGSDSRADAKNVALGGGKNLRQSAPLADVQMLLHVSADRQNASIVSIPRDTIVPIPKCTGKDGTTFQATTTSPINETLGRGGPGCTLTTWESLTGVYIDHWMMIDFAGVVAMADEVGGVPVCVKTGVWDKPTRLVKGGSGLQLPEGTHEIQGKQALQWLRTRHAFGNDQGRAKAQHMYLNGMVEKLQKQNAWSDTGQLMGLAETATQALQVSDELKSVKKLFDLSMQLKNVKMNRLTTATVPTVDWPQDKNKLEMVKSSADKMWAMLRDDIAFDKNGKPATAKPKPSASAKPKTAAEDPGSFPVTVANGTAGTDEAPVEGRAKAITAALTEKGFTQAGSSQEPQPREDTVVLYPKDAGDQGRANAVSVAKALGLPEAKVRADATAEGITLIVGADWREGTAYKKPAAEAGDLPEGADDKATCMDIYSVYKWDGKS
ncbi:MULTISPECIES: LCP family protein [unclassified Streptomyces]|uniref:LCP family protein n=1 Tax=unclassified Streptomyces TaxID=2593676 RepID=UPI001E59B77F|nr:LCP family protein [Streptomyces sp. CB02980]MCB8908284.1 LCP family protein [Streptomyces sp. CB02980]